MNLREHNVKEIYGTFDGKSFVGEDGKIFHINENYISKSRLLPGDGMKMIITESNIFFKQISQVPRDRKIGYVVILPDGNHGYAVYVMIDGNRYSVPEVTKRYYQLKQGDEVVADIEKGGVGEMCAIDCVIEKV